MWLFSVSLSVFSGNLNANLTTGKSDLTKFRIHKTLGKFSMSTK